MAIFTCLFFKNSLLNSYNHTVIMINTYLNTAMLIKGIKRTLRRIPILNNAIARLKKKEEPGTTADYDLEIYHSRSALFKKYGIDITNKVLMDIGCGNNCAHAFEFLASGAKEIILCEILAKDYFSKSKIKKRLPSNKKDYFDRFSKSLRIIDDSIEDIKSLPDSSVDIIISISLLEHVYDLEKAFKEMKRVLKKDGHMFHSIDLRDHFFFDYPLHFLRYSPWWWKNFCTKPETFTNRHRLPYYLDLIKEHGFEILYKNTESTKQETDKIGLHETFRKYSQEENRVVQFKFIAQKK
jgi:ubiquinone/menaquinone biosynthesis C-methylase UbiE